MRKLRTQEVAGLDQAQSNSWAQGPAKAAQVCAGTDADRAGKGVTSTQDSLETGPEPYESCSSSFSKQEGQAELHPGEEALRGFRGRGWTLLGPATWLLGPTDTCLGQRELPSRILAFDS